MSYNYCEFRPHPSIGWGHFPGVVGFESQPVKAFLDYVTRWGSEITRKPFSATSVLSLSHHWCNSPCRVKRESFLDYNNAIKENDGFNNRTAWQKCNRPRCALALPRTSRPGCPLALSLMFEPPSVFRIISGRLTNVIHHFKMVWPVRWIPNLACREKVQKPRVDSLCYLSSSA